MSEQKFLRPAAGVKVRRPDGGHLPEDGATIEMTSYWQRRLADGDVIQSKPAAPAAVDRVPEAGRSKSNRE